MNTLSSDCFQANAISADTRHINRHLASTLAQMAVPSGLAELRHAYNNGALGLPVNTRSTSIRRLSIEGPSGPIDLRICQPRQVRGAYLYFHGGGWMLGSNDNSDEQLNQISTQAGLVTISVQYRLAPEHPFPAPVDDCVAAANWLIRHARTEFGTDWLGIGGESAGAHLAAMTLLTLRDAGLGSSFRAANLMYGCFDLSLSPSLRRAPADAAFVSPAAVSAMVDHFRNGLDPRDSRLSPLYADLSNLPPALFSVGTGDPLLDDSLFMHARWQAAGNSSEIAIYPGGVHGFNFLPGELATRANQTVADYLNRQVTMQASPEVGQ